MNFKNFLKQFLPWKNRNILYKDERIKIGDNVFIEESAKLKIIQGGEIVIGNNCGILDGVLIMTYGGNISIGSNCSINPYTIIYGHGGTKIGNNVLIAGHCMIIPNNHVYKDRSKTIWEQGNISKGINIEDDVWIAHNCSILDGVTLEKGSVVAAGAVVNKNVPAYAVVAGVPAKIIKYRV